MVSSFDLCGLIQNGGIYRNIEGSTYQEIYENICRTIKLPEYCSRMAIENELIQREDVLSTAVGNGIAIPHPRRPVLKNADDQRLCICYLKNPIDMNAPDGRRVKVMFVLLTSSTQFHLQTLSSLAKLFHNKDFKYVLENNPSDNELLLAIKKARS